MHWNILKHSSQFGIMTLNQFIQAHPSSTCRHYQSAQPWMIQNSLTPTNPNFMATRNAKLVPRSSKSLTTGPTNDRIREVACLRISLQERRHFCDMLEGGGLSLGHKSLWTHLPASQAVKAYVEHWPHCSIKSIWSRLKMGQWHTTKPKNRSYNSAVGRSLKLLVPSKWAVGSMILSHVHVPWLVGPHGLRHLSLVFSQLSVSEMGLYIHITPLFSRQWLGLLCRVDVLELIATCLSKLASGALWHRSPVQTQGVCCLFARGKVPPLILAPIGSGENGLATGERALEVGKAMPLVLRRGHVLQICQRIVAGIHILVIDLSVLCSWWRSKKSVGHEAMNEFPVRLAWDRHRRSNIPVFLTITQRYDTWLRLDSPKWTHLSAWHSCASSGTDHGFPLFSWEIATSSFSEFSELVFTTINNCILVAPIANGRFGKP